MTKFLMMTALVMAIGGVTTEGTYAKGGSFLGQPSDLFDSIAVSSSKTRKNAKEATSTNRAKRTNRKQK